MAGRKKFYICTLLFYLISRSRISKSDRCLTSHFYLLPYACFDQNQKESKASEIVGQYRTFLCAKKIWNFVMYGWRIDWCYRETGCCREVHYIWSEARSKFKDSWDMDTNSQIIRIECDDSTAMIVSALVLDSAHQWKCFAGLCGQKAWMVSTMQASSQIGDSMSVHMRPKGLLEDQARALGVGKPKTWLGIGWVGLYVDDIVTNSLWRLIFDDLL